MFRASSSSRGWLVFRVPVLESDSSQKASSSPLPVDFDLWDSDFNPQKGIYLMGPETNPKVFCSLCRADKSFIKALRQVDP